MSSAIAEYASRLSNAKDLQALAEIAVSAAAYLEARDELREREDAHMELVAMYELQPGDLDAAEAALTRAEEREALALDRLRAKVAAW